MYKCTTIAVLFLVTSLEASTTGDGGKTLKILDSKNSRLYRGPVNPRSDGGRPLSSMILRERSEEADVSSRYFTGSTKPVWDDDQVESKINYHSIECSSGMACSQTIPLFEDSADYDQDYYAYSPSYNEIEVDVPARPTFRPRPPSSTTTSPPYTMGLSVASSYGYDENRLPTWPPVTRRPTYTTSRPRRQSQSSYGNFYAAETLPEPVYSSYAHHNQHNYDPFAFHAVHAKKSDTSTRRNSATHNVRANFHQMPGQRYSHYTSSRLSNIGGVPEPNFVSYNRDKDMYRSSLTWRNKRRPFNPIGTWEQSQNRWAQSQQQYSSYGRPPVNRRSGYDYRNEHTRRNPYFPNSNSNNYGDDRRRPAYQGQRPESGFYEEEEKNVPKRSYFPTTGQEYSSNSNDNEQHQSTPFIGQGQVLNTGYTVAENPVEAVVEANTYDDRYGWTDKYAANSHDSNNDYVSKQPDIDRWYEVTVRPTATQRPTGTTTLKPWTSLAIAKPIWDEKGTNPVHNEKIENQEEQTYGTWNKNTLK